MKNLLSLLFISLIFLIRCDPIIGSDSPETYVEPSDIIGEWVRVTEKPSKIPGLYEKDTSTYRVGIDSLPYTGPYYKKDPLTFYVCYEQGATYGYIHEPKEEYDWEEQISYLKYTLVSGLPGPTSTDAISFSIPEADSMVIKINSEEFGVRKRRP